MSGATSIEVVSWGVASSVVDAGVPGRAWLGMARGGAVDLGAFGLANRLVGNDGGAGVLETCGGVVLRMRRAVVIALAGAVADVAVDGGPPVGWGAPTALPAGAVVRIRSMVDGARAYVAVRGGLVRRANGLDLGAEPTTPPATMPAVPAQRPAAIRLWRGPRIDRLEPGSWERLLDATPTVTATSRVGTRLGGIELRHMPGARLESEGMVEGAVQVPPDGAPIIMLADHPTTGGYPVVAVVDPDDMWVVAQASAGDSLRFAAVQRSVLG